MAKVSEPLPPEMRPADLPANFSYALIKGQWVVIQRVPKNDWTREEAIAAAAPKDAALAAWKKLSRWKKWRWSLCAWKHGDPFAQADATQGWAGTTLYVREYIAQACTGTRQPISPCARRTYDPSASPFDWTP